MKVSLGFFCFIFNIIGSNLLIIPDELPSILSVIYSNIPTLKKGTDSRIGWGFRLGDRADFQVLVELGPQTNTQPLANQGDDRGANKRNTLNNLANSLYAQRQHDKKSKKSEQNQNMNDNDAVKSRSKQWLEDWSKTMREAEPNDTAVSLHAKPGIAIGEIDAKSVIPEDVEIDVKQEAIKSKKPEIKTSSKKPITEPQSLVSILTRSDEKLTNK